MIELLIALLKRCDDTNQKAILIQIYIASEGPIPDEYADQIKLLMQ